MGRTLAAALVVLGAFGQTESAPYQYQRLGGIAADARGYVYAADNERGGVLKYTTAGEYVRTIGRGAIRFPEGVAIGPDGNVYVVEGASDATRVSVWTPTGSYVRAFGDFGSGPGQLASPKQVALDAQGFVYVADSGNSRIERFSPDGGYAGSIGQGGSVVAGPDRLADPRGVAVGADGTIWAADELYRRVQHYSAAGAFLGTFGSQGYADGQFQAPSGVAVFGGVVYVADRSLSTIQGFGFDGAFTGRVGGTPGAGPGQFSHPQYLAVDCRGTLYVSDRDNNRIQRLGVPGTAACGDPAADASERLVVKAAAARGQRFRRDFAVLARVGCDRVCTVKVSGSVRIKGRRRALRIRSQTKAIDETRPWEARVAPGERNTDRVLAALRRHRRVVAALRVEAVDLRGQRARRSLRVRLR